MIEYPRPENGEERERGMREREKKRERARERERADEGRKGKREKGGILTDHSPWPCGRQSYWSRTLVNHGWLDKDEKWGRDSRVSSKIMTPVYVFFNTCTGRYLIQRFDSMEVR